MQIISFQIDEKLSSKLDHFCKVQDRSKAYLIRKALESYLQDQADLEVAKEALEEFYSEGFKTYSLEDIKKENEL